MARPGSSTEASQPVSIVSTRSVASNSCVSSAASSATSPPFGHGITSSSF